MTTPAEWRKRAAEYDAKAKAAADRGDKDEALVMVRAAWVAQDAAEEIEELARAKGLLPRNNPRIVSEAKVTATQLRRRGVAVARGKAAKSKSVVAKAITASSFHTLTAYARHLRISQPALSRYINGGLPCPRFVADAVKADFGLDHKVWPKGVVD